MTSFRHPSRLARLLFSLLPFLLLLEVATCDEHYQGSDDSPHLVRRRRRRAVYDVSVYEDNDSGANTAAAPSSFAQQVAINTMYNDEEDINRLLGAHYDMSMDGKGKGKGKGSSKSPKSPKSPKSGKGKGGSSKGAKE